MAEQFNEKAIQGNARETAQKGPVNVTTLETSQDNSSTDSNKEELAWQPGFRARFPYLGVACLCTVILMAVASILVLVFSNKKPETRWHKKIAPNVLLSVFNSISSICITIAVGQGIAIAWWRKALKGSTVEELHSSWAFGSSLSSIVLKYKYFNAIALAALITKLGIVDGILFQRSTSTYVALGPVEKVNITTYPTEVFPTTGSLNTYGNDTRILSSAFAGDVWTWVRSPDGSIYGTYGFGDCEGTCYVEVPALGFTINCTSSNETVDFLRNVKEAMVNSTVDVQTSTDIFNVNFTLMFPSAESNYSWIQVETVNYDIDSNPTPDPAAICPGTLTKQTCALRPALISYPVVMQFTNASTKNIDQHSPSVNVMLGTLNDTTGLYEGIDYYQSGTNQVPGFKFIKYIDIPGLPAGLANSLKTTRVGGISYALEENFASSAQIITHSNSTHWSTQTNQQFASLSQYSQAGTHNVSCPYSYQDPIPDIMTGINDLMFIVSDDLENRPAFANVSGEAAVDQYYNDNTEYVSAEQYRNVIHYQSNFAYLWGALASTLVCVICILPAYWGFWELGRPVSLGPFEIANAFQAPVLAEVHSGAGHVDEVVKAAGSQQVRYAAVPDEKYGTTYKFADAGN